MSSGGRDDPDVQVVLGVLYNVSHDYDSAAVAFRKAITECPDDYSIWNKVRKLCRDGLRDGDALRPDLSSGVRKPLT